MIGKNNDMVFLAFVKNAVGNGYYYAIPVYCTERSYQKKSSIPFQNTRKQYYYIEAGKLKYKNFHNEDIISVNQLVDKMKDDSPSNIPASGRPNGDIIYLKLDEEVERYVYENMKDWVGREPSRGELMRFVAVFGEQIGKAIDYISKGKNGNLDIITKGNLNNFKLSNNQIIPLVETVFEDPKSAKMQATANAGSTTVNNNASNRPNSTSTFPTSKEVAARRNANRVAQNEPPKAENKENGNRAPIKLNGAEIKAELRKKIIGQDEAIDKVVNNIVINQVKIDSSEDTLENSKTNILLDGPTGTGKTFILREVAKHVGIPIVVTSATNYSTVGYKGADLSGILYSLLENAKGDLELAERGIVVFDEFDKLGGTGKNDDLAIRKGIQDELLPFIFGEKTPSIEYNGAIVNFDTSKLTFVAMGAFTDLREAKIKENEKKHKNGIGFTTSNEEDYDRTYTITVEDYINAGIKRELVGRFACLASTNELSVKDLRNILTDSTVSPLKQLLTTGKVMGCEIVVDDDLIDQIAQMAFDANVGARGLTQIVQLLQDTISNDLVSGVDKIHITQENLERAKNVSVRTYNDRRL